MSLPEVGGQRPGLELAVASGNVLPEMRHSSNGSEVSHVRPAVGGKRSKRKRKVALDVT